MNFLFSKRSRIIRFTRFGAFYVLFSIGVGAAAINTGNNLLYLMLGILLGFIIISGFFSDSAIWGISTEWQPLNSFYAGEKARFLCRAAKGWFPGVAVTLRTTWDDGSVVSSFLPWISSREEAAVEVELTPSRRGYLTLNECRYSTVFPFGLFQKSRTRPRQERWIVYPRVRLLPAAWSENLGENKSLASSNRQGLGSVPYMLRDYRAGDALRQVQWKMSAKRQRLIVKETEEEAIEGDLFFLDVWPSGLTGEQMESFISFTASLVYSAYQRGRPVGLSVPGRFFSPDHSRHHLHQLFTFLALVHPQDNARSMDVRRPAVHARRQNILTLWTSYAQ